MTPDPEQSAPAPIPALTPDLVSGAADPTFSAARELIARAEHFDGSSPVSDQALLAAAQSQRTMLAFLEGDAHVAVGILGDGEVDLVVSPEARGRGIGTAALRILIAESPEELRAWAHGENPAAEALLTQAGFTPVRSLFRMALDPALLPHDGPDPERLQPPAGFTLRQFSSDRPADVDEWVTVNAAAFATHPEQGRITAADFRLVAAEPWFDPDDLFLLAGADGALAGSTWIKTITGAPGTSPECELYAIGIHPNFAGHGLGRYLLEVTLARMAQHDPSRVTLYVDGDNERAVQLYLKAGFTIDSHSRQWARSETTTQGARMDA